MELTEPEKDALRELANMGAAHAATALSAMIERPVTITVPEVDFLPITTIPDMVGKEEGVVGIYTNLSADVEASILIVLKEVPAGYLLDVLLNDSEVTAKDMSDMALSALQEVGNIMTSAFSNALADFMEMKVTHDPPGVGVDMAGALLDNLLIDIGKLTDETIFFNTDLLIPPGTLLGQIFLSPSQETKEKILARVKEIVAGD